MSVEESGRYSSIVTLVNFVEETAEEANYTVGVSESREREFSRRGQNKSGKSKGTSRFGEQQQLQALGNQQNQQQQREESCQGTGHGRIDDRGKKQLSGCLCRSACPWFGCVLSVHSDVLAGSASFCLGKKALFQLFGWEAYCKRV